jgi:hypothetical protein
MNKWEVVPFFDYDDYYQVGRTVMVDGKYKFESKGIRYREKSKAQNHTNKLNKELANEPS